MFITLDNITLDRFYYILEGPTEHVHARWMYNLHGFLHGIEPIMFHGHLDYSQKLHVGGRFNRKPGNHGTLNAYNRRFILFHHAWGPTWINELIEIAFGWEHGHIWLHTTLEGPWPHYMILKVTWVGLRTLSFGLSPSNGHSSWLVCKVARKLKK